MSESVDSPQTQSHPVAITCSPAAVLVLMTVTLFDSFSERFLFWQKERIKASGWWWRWWEREGADQAVDVWGMLPLTFGMAFLSAMVFWLSLQGTCVLGIFFQWQRGRSAPWGRRKLLDYSPDEVVLPEMWTSHTSCVTPLPSHSEIFLVLVFFKTISHNDLLLAEITVMWFFFCISPKSSFHIVLSRNG